MLVLDEPANGLDPQGIRWLRDLLRSLAAEGRTVLLSSHVLAEIAQTVDEVVIIHRAGSCGSDDGRGRGDGGRRGARAHSGARLAALACSGLLSHTIAEGTLGVAAPPERVGEVASANGIVLHELTTSGRPRGGLPQPDRLGRFGRLGRVTALVTAELLKFRTTRTAIGVLLAALALVALAAAGTVGTAEDNALGHAGRRTRSRARSSQASSPSSSGSCR